MFQGPLGMHPSFLTSFKLSLIGLTCFHRWKQYGGSLADPRARGRKDAFLKYSNRAMVCFSKETMELQRCMVCVSIANLPIMLVYRIVCGSVNNMKGLTSYIGEE